MFLNNFENIVGNGALAHNEQMLHSPQTFQNPPASDAPAPTCRSDPFAFAFLA